MTRALNSANFMLGPGVGTVLLPTTMKRLEPLGQTKLYKRLAVLTMKLRPQVGGERKKNLPCESPEKVAYVAKCSIAG